MVIYRQILELCMSLRIKIVKDLYIKILVVFQDLQDKIEVMIIHVEIVNLIKFKEFRVTIVHQQDKYPKIKHFHILILIMGFLMNMELEFLNRRVVVKFQQKVVNLWDKDKCKKTVHCLVLKNYQKLHQKEEKPLERQFKLWVKWQLNMDFMEKVQDLKLVLKV